MQIDFSHRKIKSWHFKITLTRSQPESYCSQGLRDRESFRF